MLLVVKHVEKGQTPQKLKQSHDYGPWRPAFSCKTCGKVKTWWPALNSKNLEDSRILLLVVKYVEKGQRPWQTAFSCKKCEKRGRHRRKSNNHIVLGHDDLLFVVKHVEKGQTPQKL